MPPRKKNKDEDAQEQREMRRDGLDQQSRLTAEDTTRADYLDTHTIAELQHQTSQDMPNEPAIGGGTTSAISSDRKISPAITTTNSAEEASTVKLKDARKSKFDSLQAGKGRTFVADAGRYPLQPARRKYYGENQWEDIPEVVIDFANGPVTFDPKQDKETLELLDKELEAAKDNPKHRAMMHSLAEVKEGEIRPPIENWDRIAPERRATIAKEAMLDIEHCIMYEKQSQNNERVVQQLDAMLDVPMEEEGDLTVPEF